MSGASNDDEIFDPDDPAPPDRVDPGTRSRNFKFLPAQIIAILAVLVGAYFASPRNDRRALDTSSYGSCVATFDYGQPVHEILSLARSWSTESWEIAATHEALLNVYHPDISVFGSEPFPDGKPPLLGARLDEASVYASNHITPAGETLRDGEEISGGPASLGVAALMLSQRWKTHVQAATRQKDALCAAPRFSNGAISHHAARVEITPESAGRIAPFLAYHAVVHEDIAAMREAVRQLGLWRDLLKISTGPQQGLWKHIVDGSQHLDARPHATGNAIVAYGMSRVRATLVGWGTSNATLHQEIVRLDSWISEILHAIVRNDHDGTGRLRKYLNDEVGGVGETAAVALTAATIYRMATRRLDPFGKEKLLSWAHAARQIVQQQVRTDGWIAAVTASRDPDLGDGMLFSAECQSYVLLLATAWRDCVCAGLCLGKYLNETERELAAVGTPSSIKRTGTVYEYFTIPSTVFGDYPNAFDWVEDAFGISLQSIIDYSRAPFKPR